MGSTDVLISLSRAKLHARSCFPYYENSAVAWPWSRTLGFSLHISIWGLTENVHYFPISHGTSVYSVRVASYCGSGIKVAFTETYTAPEHSLIPVPNQNRQPPESSDKGSENYSKVWFLL